MSSRGLGMNWISLISNVFECMKYIQNINVHRADKEKQTLLVEIDAISTNFDASQKARVSGPSNLRKDKKNQVSSSPTISLLGPCREQTGRSGRYGEKTQGSS